MEARDDFTLHWCKVHQNWYQFNCPDCMVDSNEEDIKRAGIREVVEWVERVPPVSGLPEGDMKHYAISTEQWQAKLKEWGL